jgi:hypothetical protein
VPTSTGPLATFRLDVEYVRIAPALATAGVRTILLKGPAFDQLLFGGKRSRAYSDIDLLVDPARGRAAGQVLEQLGFRRAERASAVHRGVRRTGLAVGVVKHAHATAWIRDRDGFTVDLHVTLPAVGAPAGEVWHALEKHHAVITVVESQVETLDRQASAMLIALHAAHHGPGWNRARADLDRACESLERDCWRAAARLARELRAEDEMGIGLGTTDAGRAIARELDLRTRPTLADRVRWSIHRRL